MSNGPFDISAVITRLKTLVPALKLVQGSADLATAVTSGAPQTPMAFVLLAAEQAPQTYGSSEAHVQTVRTTINVVFAVRNYRATELGAQVSDDLNAIVTASRDAILGWAPNTYYSNFELAGGRLDNYTNATAWWVEAYSINYFLRVMPQ